MSWDKNTILGELASSKGYDVALFTTYNFEVNFFEQQVLALLAANGTKIVNLFVDSKELNKAISNAYSRALGREYFVTPVLMNGAFHQKVILLLGDKKAKLIVSSANIKTSGYIFNNEVYNTFEYNEKKQDYAEVVASVVEFFKQLCLESNNVDSEIKARLSVYTLPKKTNNDVTLVFNVKETILSQLRKLIKGNVKKINVAVPFYDSDLDAISSLKKTFGCNEIDVYIQNGNNTFPYDFNLKNRTIRESSIHLFNKINDKKGSGAFYHGKVIEFITDKQSYVLYGSANCSSSALSMTRKQGGNIECDVLVRSDVNANNEFFKKFEIIPNNTIIPGFETSPLEVTPDYSFLFGESENEGTVVKLYFTFKKRKGLEVYYKETQLQSAFINDFLEVSLPLEVFDSANSVFNITIKSGNTICDVPCWFNDVTRLNYYRFSEKLVELPYITNKVDLREYMPYIKPVADALFDKAWYKIAEESTINKEIRQKNPDDEDVDDINDEFILKEDIQDDFVEKKYLTSVYRNVRVLSGRYYSLITGKKPERKKNEEIPTELHYPKPSLKKEEANAAEKWLGRFYKRNIKIMFNPDNKKTKSYSEYKYMFGTILDNIQLIFYNQRKEGFLDHRYIIDTKTRYANLLLDKAKKENNFNDFEFLICFVLLTVVERTRYISIKDEEAQKLFDRITSMVNIRDTFQKYLDSDKLTSVLVLDKDETTDADYSNDLNELMTFAMTTLDSLFHFMTWEQLNSYFRKRYGYKTEISFVGNEVEVYVLQNSDTFKTDVTLPIKDMAEIEGYIDGYNLQISKKKIVFRNMGEQKRIEFYKKGNKVIRTLYNGKNKVSFYCKRNDNGAWVIDFSRRIKD